MDQVDFGFVGAKKKTIYKNCFQKYIHLKNQIGLQLMKRPQESWDEDFLSKTLRKHECKTLLAKTESVFEFLVEEGNKRGFDVDAILEIPTSTGDTCFSDASGWSKKIAQYIIGRNIKVNNIKYDMSVPGFDYPDLAVPMMKKGINPHVISSIGKSRIDRFPSSFKSDEAKQLLAQFPKSIHYSIEDIKCGDTCSSDCSSAFERCYFKNGEFVEMIDANRIGEGGFGSVYKGSFHGKEKAMKCVPIEPIEDRTTVDDAASDLETSLYELRIQKSCWRSGILTPEALIRQQNQEQDENGEWIANNYNIYIYPLYDCNLYELHENFYNEFTDEIMWIIMFQCFNRKCSNRRPYQEQKQGRRPYI